MGKNVEKSKTKKTEVKKKPLSLKERNKAIRELSKEVNRKSYLRFMEDLIVSSISKCDITPTSNISIKNN